MGIGNTLVSVILRSPVHRLLSGSTGLVRYVGRMTQRTITTPTQYVRSGDELLILVARPETKTWWRNFQSDHTLDVLIEGQWMPLIGRVVDGSTQPDRVGPLLDLYVERFPKALHAMSGNSREERIRNVVFVWCQPRLARVEPAHGFHLPHPHLPHIEVKPLDVDPV